MQKVVIKHYNEYHKDYVSYEQNQVSYSNSSEIAFIIDAIIKEYPNYGRENIQLAVNYVCNSVTPCCPTQTFLKLVKSNYEDELEKLPPLFSEQIIQNMKYLKEARESLFDYETNKKMSKELYLKIKELLVIIRKT